MMNSTIFILIIITIFSMNIKMSISLFKCKEDGFFADSSDCWVYHICDGGTHSVRACEEDLLFNPKTGLCDWPMNVECKKTTTTRPTTTKMTRPFLTNKNEQTTSQKPRQTTSYYQIDDSLLNIDPSIESMCTPSDYGYFAYPNDCRKYIYCQEGVAKVFTCQGGLLWKQADANCVWPLDSDCPTLQKPTTSSLMPLNPNKLPNSPQALAILKENYGTIECQLDVTGFYPNPYDCSAYHFCNGGKDQVILCEPGLNYRSDKQVCDWPVNTNCVPKCPSHVDKYRFIDPRSCCRYYECINGRPVIQLCQYPLLFDVYTKQCLDYSKVKCGIRRDCTNPCQYFTNEDPSLCEMVPNCNGKPQGVYLDQNRANCQFFYTCRDNRVFNHTRCSGNLRFNQFEGRCMTPNLVTCKANNLLPIYAFYLNNFCFTIIILFVYYF